MCTGLSYESRPTVDTSDQHGNTGNKHSIFVSTGGSRTDNISNYHTSSYNDHCTVSNYNQQKNGMQVSGVKTGRRIMSYKLMKTPDGDQILAVYRLSDGASIPFDEGNMDYIEYKAWFMLETHHKNPNSLTSIKKYFII